MHARVQVQHGGAASTSPAGGVQHRGNRVVPGCGQLSSKLGSLLVIFLQGCYSILGI